MLNADSQLHTYFQSGGRTIRCSSDCSTGRVPLLRFPLCLRPTSGRHWSTCAALAPLNSGWPCAPGPSSWRPQAGRMRPLPGSWDTTTPECGNGGTALPPGGWPGCGTARVVAGPGAFPPAAGADRQTGVNPARWGRPGLGALVGARPARRNRAPPHRRRWDGTIPICRYARGATCAGNGSTSGTGRSTSWWCRT